MPTADLLIILLPGWVINWQLGGIAHAQTPKITPLQEQIQTLISVGQALLWHLSRDKLAPHDMLCGTRVVLGKTGA